MPGFLFQIEKRQDKLLEKVQKTKPSKEEPLPFKTEGLSKLEIERMLKERALKRKVEEQAKTKKIKASKPVTAPESKAPPELVEFFFNHGLHVHTMPKVFVTNPTKGKAKMKVLATSLQEDVHDRLEDFVKKAKGKGLKQFGSKKELAARCIELGLAQMEVALLRTDTAEELEKTKTGGLVEKTKTGGAMEKTCSTEELEKTKTGGLVEKTLSAKELAELIANNTGSKWIAESKDSSTEVKLLHTNSRFTVTQTAKAFEVNVPENVLIAPDVIPHTFGGLPVNQNRVRAE